MSNLFPVTPATSQQADATPLNYSYNAVRRTIGSLVERISALEAELASKSARVADLEAMRPLISANQAVAEKQNSQIERLQQDLDNQEVGKASLRHDIARIADELNNLKDVEVVTDGLQTKVAAYGNMSDSHQERLKMLEDDNKALRDVVKALQETVNNLSNEMVSRFAALTTPARDPIHGLEIQQSGIPHHKRQASGNAEALTQSSKRPRISTNDENAQPVLQTTDGTIAKLEPGTVTRVREPSPDGLSRAATERFQYVRALKEFDPTDFTKYAALHKDFLSRSHRFSFFKQPINHEDNEYYLHTGEDEMVTTCPRSELVHAPKETQQSDDQRNAIKGLGIIEAYEMGPRGKVLGKGASSFYLLPLGQLYRKECNISKNKTESTGWFVFIDVARKEKPVYLIFRQNTYEGDKCVSRATYSSHTLGLDAGSNNRRDFFTIMSSVNDWPMQPDQIVIPEDKIRKALERNGQSLNVAFTRPLLAWMIDRIEEGWRKSITFAESTAKDTVGAASRRSADAGTGTAARQSSTTIPSRTGNIAGVRNSNVQAGQKSGRSVDSSSTPAVKKPLAELSAGAAGAAATGRTQVRASTALRRSSASQPRSSEPKSDDSSRGPGRFAKGTTKADYGNASSGPGLPPRRR